MQLVQRDADRWYLDEWLWVPKTEIAEDQLRASLTLESPDGQPLQLYEETERHLLLPRAFYGELIPTERVVDCRPSQYPWVDIRSRLVLDALHPEQTIQREAIAALTEGRDGVLQLSCGTGKTALALHYASIAQTPTIILVDTDELIRQWLEEAERWLEIPGGIGLVGRGKFDWEGRGLVIATYHTVAGRAEELPEEFRRYFGLSIWDEGHHLAARTFSKTATVFYGQRVVLTAQPRRKDNLHVVYYMHVGPVMYKNLHQDLTTRITFRWSGIHVDMEDQAVVSRVCDTRGEVHFGLLSAYLGTVEPRIQMILGLVRTLLAEGRKVLVLSISIQTLTNLLAAWVGSPERYQNVPYPTLSEVGEGDFEGTPTLLPPYDAAELEKQEARMQELVATGSERDRQMAQQALDRYAARRNSDRVFKKLEREHYKRRMQLVARLADQATDAGIMIRGVGSARRKQAIKDRRLTFSVAKYGKEGLNSRELDTVIACEPMTDPAGIQQFLGRPARSLPGKQAPRAIFIEDDVPLSRGMSAAMRRVLRDWPLDEGGPLEYDFEGYPQRAPAFRAPARNRGSRQ